MTGDMRFADYFLFTQHSLSTFDNCPLKFKKRYLENLKWNSFPDEQVKRRLEKGNNFHLLAQRYFMGIDTGLYEFSMEYPELNGLLENLKKSFKIKSDAEYLPEYKLRMSSGKIKLEANFDLIIAKDGKLEIWDWKTQGGKKEPDGKRFRESLQTMVYLYVLKEQSELVCGRAAECDKISMCYWQPESMKLLARIDYSEQLHQRYKDILESKINYILGYDYSRFDKALYEKHCKYCEFNWYCNNARVDFMTLEDDDGFMDALDWDSIEERF